MTTPAAERSGSAAAQAIVRDIARGGLAGLVTGLLVAGVGGRLVMRIAALLVPGSAGAFTAKITRRHSMELIVNSGKESVEYAFVAFAPLS